MCDKCFEKVSAGNLDVLRGLAVLLVVLSHADAYEMMLPQNKFILFFKHSFGQVGVMLFFILSGYLIWQSATRCLQSYKNPWQQYFCQRVFRILPLYVVSIAVVAFFQDSFKAAHIPEVTLNNVLRHLTFTQDINPSVARTINPVLWSLTHEAIFYCLVPVLMALSRFPKYFISLLVGTLGLLLFGFFEPNTLFANFYKYCVLFAVGISIAHYGYQLKNLLSLAFILVAAFTTLLMSKQYDFIGYLVIAICMFCLVSQNKLFEYKFFLPLSYLGLISYSVYVWHYLIIEWLYPLTLKSHVLAYLPVRSIFTTLIILVISSATYVLIERPFLRIAKQKSIQNILSKRQLKHA